VRASETSAASGSTDVSVHAGADPAPTLKSQSAADALTLPAGEGIGLSIVKRLCELLDASLELETAAGEGTTFRVVMPAAYLDNPLSDDEPPDTRPGPSSLV